MSYLKNPCLHVLYRNTGPDSPSREVKVNHNRTAPVSPKHNLSSPCRTQEVAWHLSRDEVVEEPKLNKTFDDSAAIASVDEKQMLKRQKRHRFCCF